MRHPDDQLQAARDLLADGLSRAETAARIADDFGVSLRTGFRVARAVSDDTSDTDPVTDTGQGSTDYLRSAIETMHRAMVAAAQANDHATAFERGERLAGALSKAKVSRWSL